MIQRIQSIWLLLAALTITSLLFVPISSAVIDNIQYTLTGTGITEKTPETSNTFINQPLVASVILAGLISLVNIFNFRNRKLQIRIASLNILLTLGLSFWLSQLMKTATQLKNIEIQAGLFFPMLTIIFTLLAIRGIKQDEKLIKSADRLR